MKLLAKMLALVATKFEHKLDRQGKPYTLHCLHVMQTCGLTDENSLCIALGHDLIEDTDVTIRYIEENFNEEIAIGISVLTKSVNQNYDDYISFISVHSSISPIKLADLKHNMDASRLKGLTKKDFDRMEKYMRAYTYLSKI